jgi:L-threonylcarbamoyladenylate synthase
MVAERSRSHTPTAKKTKVISKDLQQAKQLLTQNDIVAIPTETVYGLAGNAYSETALKKIYALKKRPAYNPLIVHIKSPEFLKQVACDIPEVAMALAEAFWPGPLTLVLKKLPIVPDIVTSGKDTVAVRVPNHPLTLALLQQLDFPLAAPSANPFGSISPTKAIHVDNYFKEELKMVLDGGDCERGIESTIVGFEQGQPIVYRLGSLSVEDIERVVGKVRTFTKSDTLPIAPGMLSRHYAPQTDTYLTTEVESLINTFAGKKIGLLLFKSEIKGAEVAHQEVLSASGDITEAAKNLYAALHHLDQLKLDVIIAERFPEEGLGKTINDRLGRAIKK